MLALQRDKDRRTSHCCHYSAGAVGRYAENAEDRRNAIRQALESVLAF